MHKYGVLIGRFEPFHNGHKRLVDFALQKCEELIIILGSCNTAITIKNPWDAEDRREMVLACYSHHSTDRITFVEASDYLYNDNRWMIAIQQQVDEVTDGSDDVVLFGENKDRTTFYLNMFPQWKHFSLGLDMIKDLDATKVRTRFFENRLDDLRDLIPGPVWRKLWQDQKTEKFAHLQQEYRFIQEYKASWANAPYDPTFTTTDAVAIQSGHVLLGIRKGYPGKGLIALPGGYVGDERIEDSVLRELKEEISVDLTKEELRKYIVDRHVFDHPERSLRGRTITHGFCFNLGAGKLPRVKGTDDLSKAFWMPLREVSQKENLFFEDHAHIINFFTSKF